MKYIAIILIVVGVSAIGLSIALRVQFNSAVAQGSPNFDKYPLLKPFILKTAPSSGVASAAQAAETTILRIYTAGGVGLIIAIVGSLTLIVGRAHEPRARGDFRAAPAANDFKHKATERAQHSARTMRNK